MYTFEIVPVWVLWATDYDGRRQGMMSIWDSKAKAEKNSSITEIEERKALKTTYESGRGETVTYYLLDSRVQSFEINESIDAAQQRQIESARKKLSSEDFTALVKAIREGKVK